MIPGDPEHVPSKDDIDGYFQREVRPHARPRGGTGQGQGRKLKQAEEEIMRLLREVTE